MRRSPWWYRYRAVTIGAVYFAGFFFGPLISQLAGIGFAPVFRQLADADGRGAEHGVLVAAVLLTIAACAVRSWGGAYLRPDVVWNPDALDDRLIVEGPFRYVRNPLYLGNMLLALAMCAFATPIGAAVILIGNAIVVAGLVRVEQRLLGARYGATFDAYAKAVPPVVPRLTPFSGVPSREAKPSLALGLRSELFTAAFVLATLGVAVRFW